MMFFSERKKLAEEYEKWISEKDVLDCPLTVISWLVAEGYVGKTKAADLEAKLAESEKEKEYYQDLYFTSVKGQEQLKQQLAEKEKEIISLECVISEIHNDIKEMHEFKVGEDEYDLTDSDARFSLQCDLLNNEQDKISFCIEQLEKVKEEIGNNISPIIFQDSYWLGKQTVLDKIDNQIEELKKEMK